MIITQPYQKISAASRTTGLSPNLLRRGCREGFIPHVKSGGTYYVDIPELLDMLAERQDNGEAKKSEE